MKLIEVDWLKENDVIAEPVMTSDYMILLNKGTIIKQDYLDKLKELDIKEVYIEDSPLLEDSIRLDVLASCKQHVESILKQHLFSKNERLSELKSSVDEILEYILNRPQVVTTLCELQERKPDIYEHTLNVCSMSMIIAIKLGLQKEEIRELGTAAMLHDLGLRYTTIHYENKELSDLSENDREEYKKHTIYGYSAISNADWLSEEEKKMILTHHENLSGKGYPLREENMTVAAQILAACEIMDEMLCGIGYKKKKIWEVISYLEEIKGNDYNGEIIDMICHSIAVYPTGTKLILDDGSVGIVVKQNENNAKMPVIQIIQKGSRLQHVFNEAVTLVNLEKEKDFHIVNVLEH
ncbi:MAG: HD domain-containing protein [Lachnospiraceae bacterium]|nr:HD domain-containing protein [Lachnospiraceae bacterium]